MIRWLGAVAAALFVATDAPAVGAQALMTLDGSVRAADDTPLVRAQVTATERETGAIRRAATTVEGRFVLVALPPGNYIVTARMLGYTPHSRSVRMTVGQNAHLRFTLDPAAVELPAAEVIGRSIAAEVERSSISAPVLAQEIRNLPFSTRNVMELAAVTPGVRSYRSLPQPQSRGATTIPAAGAFRDARLVNLLVDGMELKNMYNSGIVGFPETGSPIPTDALREFRVLLNPYDAEYARAGVYVISAATERGTNRTRGSVFGTYQNEALVATTAFQHALPNFTRPGYARRQAGFTMRGPLVRDRLFYASTYELASTLNQVPVVPGRPAGSPGIWDEFAGVFPAPNRNHTALARVTYALHEKHTLDATAAARLLTGTTLFGAGVAASGAAVAYDSAVDQDYGVHVLNVRHSWTPSGRLVNETSLHVLNWNHHETAHHSGPELQFPGLWIGRSSPHQRIRERHVRLVNRATTGMEWRGSHVLKSGFEIGSARASGQLPSLAAGEFTFARDSDVLPRRARFATGLNDPGSLSDGAAAVTTFVLNAYVNDEWRPRPRLTVTAGVRYDVETDRHPGSPSTWLDHLELTAIPELRPYLSHGKRRADVDNVAPRVAISWDVFADRRTFVRAGAGTMYDRAPRFATFQDRREATWRIFEVLNPGTADLDVLKQRVADGAVRATPVFTLLPARIRTPHTKQWSVGAGRQLSSGVALNVDYVQQRLENLPTLVNLNWLDLSSGVPRRALSADYGDILGWGDAARARYRALLLHLTAQRDTLTRVNLAYTLAHATADWDPDVAPVPSAMRDAFYVMQPTGADERHRAVLSAIMPLQRDFRFSVIVTAASPRPYRAIVGQDLNANGFPGDDWIDGRRFIRPAGVWRNWYRMVDVRLTKPVRLSNEVRLSLSVDAFNVFNTENYASFRGQQRDMTGQELTDFKAPSAIFATRQLQLGTRLDF
jgi:hypothetical protein